jgi:SAM-dependent methyltransferase
VPDLASIERSVARFAGDGLEEWERGYLSFHCRRFQDTLRLLPEGGGGQLLDIGAFPGHLSCLACERGWQVTGLNNAVESGGSYEAFLARCAAAGIEIRSCEVEEEPFPLPSGSFDAVLFCELFEHLYRNPFHVLRQIFRVLRPGGILILTTPNLRSWEGFLRLLHGWGTASPVSRRFLELLPSLLYHRHNREYTAKELQYFLGLQGKDLYEFVPEPVRFSSCYGEPVDVPHIVGRKMRPLVKRIYRALLDRTPSLRRQLMVRARRGDQTLVEWSALEKVSGFGEQREDFLPVQGFTRRFTFPFRTTEAEAGFDLPVPPGPGPLLLTLVLGHPETSGALPLAMTWKAGAGTVLTGTLDPSLRPLRLRLLIPEAAAAGKTLRLSLATETWANPELEVRTGPLIGGEWILAQRLGTPQAVQDAWRRLLAEHLAEEEYPPVLRLSRPLAFLAGVRADRLDIGPDDLLLLGEGWHGLERWPAGWVRWTGPEAVAFLAGSGGEERAFAQVLAGDPQLGPAEGRLTVRRSGAGGPAASSEPYRIPAGGRAVLSAPIPAGEGEITLILAADPLRRPVELIPGSQDPRPLGVAVTRLWLD